MGVTEYKIGNAIVRIHEGKLTPEERREVIEAAATQFMKKVIQARKAKSKQRSEH